MTSTHVYSTKNVPPRERFDFWREALCANFYGMTPEWDQRNAGLDFDATLRATPLSDIALIELNATGHLTQRSDRDIADHPGDAIFVYLQTHGSAWFDTPDDRNRLVTPTGSLAIGTSDRPMKTAPMKDQRFDFRLARVPLSRVSPFFDPQSITRTRAIDEHNSMTALVRGYLQLLFREAPTMDAVAAEMAVQTLARLAAVAYGLAPPEHESARDAVRDAKRQRIRAFVARHADRPELTPAVAARALGMSVRQIHALLEPTGTSFTQLVRTQRLSRARELVMIRHDVRVADIAFACGFESVGTFHRAFREAFGMPPGELRASLARGASR